jgi:hypothetical protein
MQATTPACRQAGSLICKGLRTIQRAATVEFAQRRRNVDENRKRIVGGVVCLLERYMPLQSLLKEQANGIIPTQR